MPVQELLTGRDILRPVEANDVVTDPHGNLHKEDYVNGPYSPLLQGLMNYFGFSGGASPTNPSQGAGVAGQMTTPGTGTNPSLDDPSLPAFDDVDLNQIRHDYQNGVTGSSDGSSTSAKGEGSIDISSILSSSAISSSQALTMLKDLYEKTGDKGYLELIATSLLEQENTASAREWDSHASSRALADLKAAGYNPWLLMQNGSVGGSSSTAAGVGSASVSNSARSTENVEKQLKSANMRAVLTLGLTFLLSTLRLFR